MAYVLFSPIGGTDPISTFRDGSMLHITRKYHPEHIVLFLSSEMLEREHRDHRYTDSIRRLMEQDGFSAGIECVERAELREVQEFDPFLREFENQLRELHERFPEHELLLNVSSGTPGMKSALYILGCILPYRVIPVQVATPAKKQNRHDDPNAYDPDVAWECNEDNDPAEYKDRSRVLSYKNLRAQVAKQNIETHIKAYDYEAAFNVAESIRPFLSEEALSLLNSARKRTQLNWRGIPSELQKSLGIYSLPTAWIDVREYLLWLQMKQARGDLADFLRGLTPALYSLMRFAVETNGGIKLSEYCVNGDFITREALDTEESRYLLPYFDEKYKFVEGFIQTSHYANIINGCFYARPWASPLLKLRKIESTIRNSVAHTITRVDENWVEKNTKEKINSRQIMELFYESVRGISDDEERKNAKKFKINWNSYEAMNHMIFASLV